MPLPGSFLQNAILGIVIKPYSSSIAIRGMVLVSSFVGPGLLVFLGLTASSSLLSG
jgi:hypothetical protein